MQQHIYHGGNSTPASLTDVVVQHFGTRTDVRAQKAGSGDSFIVQIDPTAQNNRPTLTLAAHRIPAQEAHGGDMAVTLGVQQWIGEDVIGFSGFAGVIELLFTKWGQNTLLWPFHEISEYSALAEEIWQVVESTTAAQGSKLIDSQTLIHPHLDDASV